MDYVREVEQELENALGRRVKLVDGAKKGRIEIEFYGAEDREKLILRLQEKYEGLDRETAAKAVDTVIGQLEAAGLTEE